MSNYYRDNDDLRYYVERGGIDWQSLTRVTENDFRLPDGFEDFEEAHAFYLEVVRMVGDFVASEVAPRAAEVDREGPKLVDGKVVHPPGFDAIFDKLKALELHGLSVPRELGGSNAPHLLNMICAEIFARADVSMMTHHSFHFGIAMALLVYSMNEGTTEFDFGSGTIASTRFEAEIRDMISGNAWGAMDITEPDAGSDMAALRTRAVQDEDGVWRVTGQKIFITSGHGKYHVVIARTGEPDSGLKGLSTFLVQTYEENADGSRTAYATIDRIEEKLGHHASPTCSVVFEDAPAQLIGDEGEGFKQMLLLMNNARIGVGLECIGLCEASCRLAREYAAERRAFGKPIDRHEMIADYLDEMETTTRGLRALAYNATYHEEMSFRLGIKLRRDGGISELERRRMEREIARHKRSTRKSTPLLKYLAAESAVEFSRRCVQIHGGVGYTTEYGAEKLLRDAMVMPIYEGTSQIQALMVMKDTLGFIIKAPQKFVRRLAEARIRAVSERDPLERRIAQLDVIALSAQQKLIQKTVVDKFKSVRKSPLLDWMSLLKTDWDPKRDFGFAMLHAERLTKILADKAIVDVLHEQTLKHPERRSLLVAYLERAEPRCRFWLDEISTTGNRLLESLESDENAAAE